MVFRFYKIKNYRQSDPHTIRKAFHEAGHATVAYIFNYCLKLDEITIDEEYAKTKNINYRAGLLISHSPIHLDQFYDHMMLIALAGRCSQTKFIKGKKYINKNMHVFATDESLFVSTGTGIDKSKWEKYANQYALLSEIDSEVLIAEGNIFIFKFMNNFLVWETIKGLALKLMEKKYLDQKEIENYFNGLIWKFFLDNYSNRILKKKYRNHS